jgi:hypothetical protein
MNRPVSPLGSRGLALALAPVALLLLAPAFAPATGSAEASAQVASLEDPRWLPWVGCWEPASHDGYGSAVTDAMGGSELLVCVSPDPDGIRIETIVEGEAVAVETFQPRGGTAPVVEGGCEGTREVRWAADGRRVYLLSELACGADARRTTQGVFAMGADGFEWIEIQAVGTGDATGSAGAPYLSVRRFQAASRATLARHDREAPAAELGLAVETSRRSAARPLGTDAVVEASEVAGSEVASALVAEMGYGFDLDARALRNLSSRGVDSEVIDMMIAVTWPQHFQVAMDGSLDHASSAYDARDARDARTLAPWPTRGYGVGITCTGWFGRCSSLDGYLGYGYPIYGFGYGYGYGYGYSPYAYSRWGWYTGPRYIVVGPGAEPRPRGTMTPDGYRPPAGTASPPRPGARPGTTAQPQSAPPAAQAAPPPTAGSSTGSSAPPPRPAQRRDPPTTGGGGGGGGG